MCVVGATVVLEVHTILSLPLPPTKPIHTNLPVSFFLLLPLCSILPIHSADGTWPPRGRVVTLRVPYSPATADVTGGHAIVLCHQLSAPWSVPMWLKHPCVSPLLCFISYR